MSEVKTKKKVALAPVKADDDVYTLIKQAVEQKLPVETMEKLFELRVKVKAEQAKEAYIVAMSEFQRDCPVIAKNKDVLNKDGSLRYQYASLDSIVSQIKDHLTKNGLSYSVDVDQKKDEIRAIAKITHILGHSETSSFAVPVDEGGFMTTPQKYASSLTFAKRYALCNALGILTGEDDTDAGDVGKEKDAKEVKSQIVFLLRNLGETPKTKEEIKKVVKKITSLELTDKNFNEIRTRLELLVKEQQTEDHEDSQVQ